MAETNIIRFSEEGKGKNIEISNNGCTAKRVSGQDEGIVILRYPMLLNRKYTFRLDAMDPPVGSNLMAYSASVLNVVQICSFLSNFSIIFLRVGSK